MNPACERFSNPSQDGFHALDQVREKINFDDYRPCNWCFPDVETVEEIDRPNEELILSLHPRATAVHRSSETGVVTSNSFAQNSLLEKLADPDFGFEDLPEAGGAD
jgi:hypothetical protein